MKSFGNAGIAKGLIIAGIGILVFTGLYFTSLISYLFFHVITELFSIVIATTIFLIAWNARKFLDNNYLLFIGIAYLFVAGLDLMHTLSYKGMGVFPGRDANEPTQLWITGRYLQAASLLIAPFFMKRTINYALVFGAYSLASGLLIAAIFYWKMFPVSYVEGTGLTTFKKVSEYIICGLLIGAGAHLIRKRSEFDEHVLKLLLASLGVAGVAGLLFTSYLHVYDRSNMAGHFLKILSFYFMYHAIVQTAVVKPYAIVFRKLKLSEDALRQERDALLKSIETIKVLTGLLPMCSACKKIRDDKGYWSRVETYLEQHSDVHFTHGLCPDCARRLYPDLFAGIDIDKIK